MSLAFVFLDGVGLALLPQLGRSFGAVTPPLLALTLARSSLTFAGGLAWGNRPALAGVAAVHLAITAVSVYATWIEPFRIQVSYEDLHSSKLDGNAPLRLLQISDLHVEQITLREERLLNLIKILDPDLIVLTGDYLNLSSVRDPACRAAVRDLLGEICGRSRGPVYAITGSPPVDLKGVVPRIFDGLPIRWLLDEVEPVEIGGHRICIAGLRCTRERSRDAPRLRRLLDGVSTNQFTLLLYHSPDLMPEAVDLGVDLYLCGHTHGGQIRLPFVGALITSSEFWKRYEMGRYEENGTILYVSRGLGMEGLGAPRARFLSPPEIIAWTLSADYAPADNVSVDNE
jgi:predicted MPP superfamily phosphohydrolase